MYYTIHIAFLYLIVHVLEENGKVPHVKMCDCEQYSPKFDTFFASLLRPTLPKVGHYDLDSVYHWREALVMVDIQSCFVNTNILLL